MWFPFIANPSRGAGNFFDDRDVSPANAGDIRDTSSIPGLGRSPEGGHGNPLQYSCLGNSMDRGTWWTTVHRVEKSQTRLKRLGTFYICAVQCGRQALAECGSWAFETWLMWLMCVCSVAQSCPTLCDPMDCSPLGPLSVEFSRQEYWSGVLFSLQGIFLTQGLNLYLLY